MDIFESLNNLLGGEISSLFSSTAPGKIEQNKELGLLNPQALTQIASALFSGKTNKYADVGVNKIGGLLISLLAENRGKSFPEQTDEQPDPRGVAAVHSGKRASAHTQERTHRLMRALIFAARADGHVDPQEQAVIEQKFKDLNLGPEDQSILIAAMQEPLDPNRVATDVVDTQEGMQIFALSCAVCGRDQISEVRYLDALAIALNIPPEVKTVIQAKMTIEEQGSSVDENNE